MMIDIHKFNGISNNSVKDYIWVYMNSVNALQITRFHIMVFGAF